MRGVKRFMAAVLFGAGVAGIVYGVSQTAGYRAFLRVQNVLDDRRFAFRDDALPESSIVIVDIDDASLAALGNFRGWPRRHFGTVIDRVNDDGARIVFLDVILRDGGTARDNATLVRAVGGNDNVIIGYYLGIDRESARRRPRDSVYNERFGIPWVAGERGNRVEFIRARDAAFSYPELSRSAPDRGFTNYLPDPDGILRHMPLYIEYNGSVLPSAALRMWTRMIGAGNSPVTITARGISLGGRFIPADKHGFLRLNFRSAGRRYPVVPFADVLDGRFPAGVFRGKVVMIGSSSPRLDDLKRVPGHAALPGVEIHAAALSTLLRRDFISVVPGNAVFVLTLFSGVLVSVLFAVVSPAAGISAALTLPPLLFFCSGYWFSSRAALLNVTVPAAAALFAGAVLAVYALIGRHERRKRMGGE